MFQIGIIHQKIDTQSNDFFNEYGYIHYRVTTKQLSSLIDKSFQYYNSAENTGSSFGFRNALGQPRHFLDVFRDKNSSTLEIFLSNELTKIISNHTKYQNDYIFTHSKISFKTKNLSKEDWFPHQDNGYKLKGYERDGFAIFICLEDMNEDNGCLQVFPKSQKLGTLMHKRIIEDRKSGDNQLSVEKVPEGMNPYSIIAKKGDIILFSSDMLHQSMASKTDSQRIALIAEIEEFQGLKLDDYGKVPFFATGSVGIYKIVLLSIYSLFSPFRIWNFLKRYKNLVLILRKIRYKEFN